MNEVRKSNLVDVVVVAHRDTDKAVLVSDGSGRRAVWLPLSQIEIVYRDRDAIVTLPEWLAIEKGLV